MWLGPMFGSPAGKYRARADVETPCPGLDNTGICLLGPESAFGAVGQTKSRPCPNLPLQAGSPTNTGLLPFPGSGRLPRFWGWEGPGKEGRLA